MNVNLRTQYISWYLVVCECQTRPSVDWRACITLNLIKDMSNQSINASVVPSLNKNMFIRRDLGTKYHLTRQAIHPGCCTGTVPVKRQHSLQSSWFRLEAPLNAFHLAICTCSLKTKKVRLRSDELFTETIAMTYRFCQACRLLGITKFKISNFTVRTIITKTCKHHLRFADVS